MNLRDCRTLDELEQFVKAEYVYGIDCQMKYLRSIQSLQVLLLK